MNIGEVFDVTKTKNFHNYAKDVKCENPFTFFITSGGYVTIPDEVGFASFKESQEARKRYLTKDYTNHGYLVLRNADFTEGRGPMIPIEVFRNANEAHNFIMAKQGIYGSPQNHSISFGVSVKGNLYCMINYNGFDIKEIIIK